MRVAIMGMGPSAREIRLNRNDWQVWAKPKDLEHGLGADLLFEMHSLEAAEAMHGREHIEHLQRCGSPIMMPKKYEEIPYSEEYPLFDVSRTIQGDYFGSTIAYMLGLAIHRKFLRISLFGVDLKKSIYDHQRPNIEYLIGLARGLGSAVFVAEGGSLLTYESDKYPTRYGYHDA